MALYDVQAATRAMEAARQTALRGRLFFGVVESTYHLARLAHSEGRLSRAAEICRQGQADIVTLLAQPEQELPALGSLDIALGCVFLEQDRLDDAETHLLHGLGLLGTGMNPYYLMAAYLALYRLREIQGRSAEALDYLNRLEDAWPDIAFCTQGLRVAHALRTVVVDPHMVKEAAAWCQHFSLLIGEDVPLPGLGPFGAADAYYLAYLAWARGQIVIGNTQAARSILERLLDLAESQDLTNRVIELSLLVAELEAKAGQAEDGNQRMWAALERALMAAQAEGYVRIFDQGPALTRLLIDAARRGMSKDYIERLLSAIAKPEDLNLWREATAPGSARTAYAESLSERELEVLHLVSQGATNHEIAEQLVITVGTVKSHINHIFVKLDAHNRTEAVARARELGLLDI
jgi:LuxR family maltose regulon positive regulatory protein